ncbi:MAG: DsbE family thiol:disulfide interchange protein [Silicimonas sp.]|nr:DsbE family thiol:disulfide interchange protein [Silicimonas sp.]
MARIPPLVLLPPIIFAALAGLFLSGMYRDDPNALPSTLEGRDAPEIVVSKLGNLPEIDPDVLTNGEVTLVNYWASWCAPCRVEHPQLMRLADEGMTILGINYKDDASKALGFLDELGDPFTAVGADPKGRTALNWGVYGVPETFVVDGNGRVVLRFAGPVTAQIYEKRIKPAIEAASAE